MRLAFLGSAAFAVPSLRRLAQEHEIAAVYCRPPAPARRGQRVHVLPVHEAADALGLPVTTPPHWKDENTHAEFAALEVELAVVVAYGLLLPPAILRAPRLGCLNLHASLLPRWRGAAPIARAVEAGDTQTGISLMQMTAGLDEGPLFAQHELEIAPQETCGELTARLAELAAGACARLLQRPNLPAPQPQAEDGVCYAAKIDKREARIDWQTDAASLARRVRALAPKPGAWFALAGERVRILLARAEAPAACAPPGTVLDDAGLIACREGALRLLRVQRASRAPMAAADFLRGAELARGTQL